MSFVVTLSHLSGSFDFSLFLVKLMGSSSANLSELPENSSKVSEIRLMKRYIKQTGSMIISLLMNITMNQLGGASVIAIFTTRRSHGYVNTTTWLGISQFFLFLVPNFNILTTENRSRCNRDLN